MVIGRHKEAGDTDLGYAPGTKLLPDYDGKCAVCGQAPTVTIADKLTGEILEQLNLCGPCCFGEASMLDVKEW